ncbi:MAG: ComEA family DNA-binding protein [Thermoanaerobaculia bacterium]
MRFARSRSLGTAAAVGLLLSAVSLSIPAAGGAAQASPVPRRVNINQASAAQLAYLPRIGEKAAARIVEYRRGHGPFSRPEELMEVKGIGEKLFLSLKPYIALSGPTTLTEKVRLAPRQNAAKPAARKSPPAASVPQGKGR